MRTESRISESVCVETAESTINVGAFGSGFELERVCAALAPRPARAREYQVRVERGWWRHMPPLPAVCISRAVPIRACTRPRPHTSEALTRFASSCRVQAGAGGAGGRRCRFFRLVSVASQPLPARAHAATLMPACNHTTHAFAGRWVLSPSRGLSRSPVRLSFDHDLEAFADAFGRWGHRATDQVRRPWRHVRWVMH